MIPELSTSAQQLGETYRLFQRAISEIPEADLDRTLGGKTRSVAAITGHVLAGQMRYNHLIANGIDGGDIPSVHFDPISHATLGAALEASLADSLAILEAVPASTLGQPLATYWGVWNDGTANDSLDVCWFAAQMVRHASYHAAQIFVYSLMLEQPEIVS